MKNSLIWQHALSISYYCRHPEEPRTAKEVWYVNRVAEEEKKKSPREGGGREEDISLFLSVPCPVSISLTPTNEKCLICI